MTAAAELAPDQWFPTVMTALVPKLQGVLFLVYTAGLMFLLRTFGSGIAHSGVERPRVGQVGWNRGRPGGLADHRLDLARRENLRPVMKEAFMRDSVGTRHPRSTLFRSLRKAPKALVGSNKQIAV